MNNNGLLQDFVTITDTYGFVHRVSFSHYPTIGLTIAYIGDVRIASREYGKMSQPTSDDDGEWEEWEERFREWTDEIISDLKLECELYFNRVTAGQ